jgi:hypothetical protein
MGWGRNWEPEVIPGVRFGCGVYGVSDWGGAKCETARLGKYAISRPSFDLYCSQWLSRPDLYLYKSSLTILRADGCPRMGSWNVLA